MRTTPWRSSGTHRIFVVFNELRAGFGFASVTGNPLNLKEEFPNFPGHSDGCTCVLQDRRSHEGLQQYGSIDTGRFAEIKRGRQVKDGVVCWSRGPLVHRRGWCRRWEVWRSRKRGWNKSPSRRGIDVEVTERRRRGHGINILAVTASK